MTTSTRSQARWAGGLAPILLWSIACSSSSAEGEGGASASTSPSSTSSTSSAGAAGGGGAGASGSTTSSGPGGTGGGGGVEGPFGSGFVEITDAIAEPFVIPISDGSDGGEEYVIETGGLFADLDGDGTSEVVLTHVTPSPGVIRGDTAPKQYHYDGQRLVLDGPFAADVFTTAGFIPRAIVDLDGDGFLDVLTSTQIAWGKAGGGFGQPQMLTPNASDRGPVQAVDVADIDSDGWLDVLLGGAHCKPGTPPLFPLLRTAPRALTETIGLVEQPIYGRSYAVMTARIEGEPMVGTLYSSCFVPEGNPPPYYRWSADEQAYAPFELLPPEYVQTKLTSPMGAAMGDLNGDGLFDLTISEKHDYFAGGTLPLTDVTEQTGFHDVPSTTLIPMIPWGVVMVDLDRDTRLDVITVHGNDFKAWFDPGWVVGPQWTTTHWNQGDFKFQEIQIGLRREGQWKSLAAGDLEGDGDIDILVGGSGEMPRGYRNDITAGHGFALRLRGTTSNGLGVGSVVDVWPVEGGPSQRFLAGNFWSPDVWSEPLVFVGLGEATKAARVEITWPSGYVQEVRELDAGKIHRVDEPPVLEVEPSTRHLAADGVSLAKLHVVPRNPDGTPREGLVTASVAGSCTLGAVTPEAGGTVVEVVAPGSPGSCQVAVSIDGEAVDVRPRIWFD
jgi:hypothetical protein